jgi:hypothetical protein
MLIVSCFLTTNSTNNKQQTNKQKKTTKKMQIQQRNFDHPIKPWEPTQMQQKFTHTQTTLTSFTLIID